MSLFMVVLNLTLVVFADAAELTTALIDSRLSTLRAARWIPMKPSELTNPRVSG